MRRTILLMTLGTVLVLVATGCATTGYPVATPVTAPRTVLQPASVHYSALARHLPLFTRALEGVGFRVGQTEDPQALHFRLDFAPNPWGMRVGAALWQAGTPVLVAEAINPGWGTMMLQDGSVVAALAESAAKAFAAELQQLLPRLTFLGE